MFLCFLSCYAQIYVFSSSLPCLCLDLHVGCYALCFCSLLSLIMPFAYVLGLRQGVDLDLVVQAYIKGFGSFHLCMFLLAYFFALDPCLFGQIQVLAMLCALHGLVLVGLWGHLLVWLHLSPLYAMILCFPCLLCATCLAFFASLHFCTLAYMFVHESVCRPYSNLMELQTFDPNLHFSFQDNLLCWITCLFAPVWLPLIVCLLACFPSSCFFACLLACFLCHCMYTLGAWTLGARVRPPRRKQKGKGCKQADTSPQKGNVQQIRRPSLLERFSLSLSSSLFPRILYQGSPLHVPFIFLAPCLGHIPQVWQCLFYISYTLLGHTLGTLAMSVYFLTLCDSIVHDVCISIYACIWVIVHFV